MGHKSFYCPKNLSATSSVVSPAKLDGASISPKNRIFVMTRVADVHPDVITGSFFANNVPTYVFI